MAAAATEPLHIQLLHCSLVALHCSSSHCTTACSSFLTAASSLQLSRTAASPLRCSYSHRRGADVRPSRSKTSKFPFWDGPTFRIGIAATCIEAVAFSGARSQKKGCCSKSQVPPTSTSPHFPVRAPSSSPSLSLSFALSTTLPAKPFSCSHIFSFSIFFTGRSGVHLSTVHLGASPPPTHAVRGRGARTAWNKVSGASWSLTGLLDLLPLRACRPWRRRQRRCLL